MLKYYKEWVGPMPLKAHFVPGKPIPLHVDRVFRGDLSTGVWEIWRDGAWRPVPNDSLQRSITFGNTMVDDITEEEALRLIPTLPALPRRLEPKDSRRRIRAQRTP